MGGEDSDKLVRIPGESLLINVSSDEEAYRRKYLPDLKKLTDEKLVCTVCSVSLAQNIHKGKDLYIHRALQVLVCEACYNFYGDGCFSADEDGDDKYCRWCGQGGTLYLCSACNCAFCQKCTKQNLKASVLAELENDDWKCYICNPRPLYGCRTICWGAQQLNSIGKEKEQERLRKIKERLEKMETKKKEKEASERKSRKVSSSEDEVSTKKRKRYSDSNSSSPEVMPKKRKRESRGNLGSKNLNGSIGRRRKDSSSNSESEDDKKVTRHSRSNNKKGKNVHSSSEDEFDSKNKKDKLKKKKKKNDSSDESSDADKKKQKRKTVKKKSSDESSDDEKSKKKKKISTKKRNDSSDSSSDENKKKKLKKKKKDTSSEDSSMETKKKKKKKLKKKADSSSDKSSDEEESSGRHKKTKSKPDKEDIRIQENADSENESKKAKKITADSEDVNPSSAEDILVKKRIQLAILWLSTVVKDISELGTLISLRATKFRKKKINAENLKSYEDVLNCVSKIKQLINGVNSNYDHIEKTLDSHLKPWKILTGLEEPDNEKSCVDGDNTVIVDGSTLKSDQTLTTKSCENNDTVHDNDLNSSLNKSKIEKNHEKIEETINNWSDDSDDQRETRALISKVNETLDKSQKEEEESEIGEKSMKDKKNYKNALEEECIDSDFKENNESNKSFQSDSGKPAGDCSDGSKCETPKKNISPNSKGIKSNKHADSDTEDEKSSHEKSLPTENNSNKEESENDLEAEGGAKYKETESEGLSMNAA